MVNSHYCMVCKTPSKLRSSLSVLRNINFHMNKFVREFRTDIPNGLKRNTEYSNIFRNISIEHMRVKMFCGSCNKINTSSFKLEEKEIYENFIKILFLFDNDYISKQQLHSVGRCIQGNYTIMYKELRDRISKKI